MITLLIAITLFGSFAIYNTSKKAVLNQNTILEKWLQDNTNYSKIISLLSFAIVTFFSVYIFGVTSAILFLSITVMFIISLLVIIYPLTIITYKHLSLAFIFMLILEITL